MSFLICSVFSNVSSETTFICDCLLFPQFVPVVLFCPLCDFVCLSVFSLFVIVQATSFDGVFLLVAFHCIALICNYCFLLCLIKQIYLSIYIYLNAAAVNQYEVIQLSHTKLKLKCKCLPALLYSLEACRLNKAQIKSLNFVVCSAFSKIFNTRSSEIVTHCMQIFDCDNIASILLKRSTKFMRKFTEGVFGDVFG